MLVLSFAVIIAFKQTSIYFKSEFPAVNCAQVEKRHTEEQLMQVAGFEFLDSELTNWESPLNGALQCFCDSEAQKDIVKWMLDYKFEQNYTISDVFGVEKSVPMCKFYQETRWKIIAMDESIKNLIIIINTVIRMLVIIIVNNVGYMTESNQMKFITNSVFICIFFNTGFLLMLCNANLGDQSALLGSYFKGNDSDFNQSWFTSMGDTIVGSMVFNVWFPVVMEFCNYGMRLGFRILDWFGRKNGALTTKTSI